MPSRWQQFFHQMRLRRLRASLCGHADFQRIATSGQARHAVHTTAITKAKTIGFQYLTTPIISHAPASLGNYQSHAEALRLRRSFSTRRLSAT